ncbi:hypothetical protein [Legionella sp.]|uniref:hypothetical protein n=1 Tax=Legionella sp. TaxID=459 RepID=UPI0032204F21
MTYCAIYSFMQKTELMEKILPGVGSFLFAFYGVCNVLMIWRGSEYVKIIEKEDDYFTLINVYNKQIKFTVSDILSAEVSKFSIVDKILTGFAKHLPGLELVLKDRSKYYITSDMENFDTLKEHLLGKLSEHM